MNQFIEQGEQPVTLRRMQKMATASVVLQAARQEFEQRGFRAASIRSIAQRAGVSAGTVLHHYGDKRELLHAALFDELDLAIRDALANKAAGKLENRLDQLAWRVFRSYQRQPALRRTQLKESLFAEGPWAARFVAQTTSVHTAIVKWTEDAVRAKELKPGVDGQLFAVAWLSFFYFAIISWVQGSHPSPVALIEKLTAQHLDGLRLRGRRS